MARHPSKTFSGGEVSPPFNSFKDDQGRSQTVAIENMYSYSMYNLLQLMWLTSELKSPDAAQ